MFYFRRHTGPIPDLEDTYLAEGTLERIRSGEEQAIPLKDLRVADKASDHSPGISSSLPIKAERAPQMIQGARSPAIGKI